MNLALISHDPASGRITVHELPTLAVIEPVVQDPDERVWDTTVTVRLSDGTRMHDTDPGHAIMEVLGLYAEDGATPRWRRRASGLPVVERDETVTVHPDVPTDVC
jgi:hypothetical protein